MSQLKEFYEKEAVPKLVKAFSYKNIMEVPRLQKVVLNMGLGEAIQNIKLLDAAAEELKTIAGQKPVITRAKKSIAAFKLREGMPIGCMVTLRRQRMYEFLDRLISLVLPRVRDFRGISRKAFDGNGNYTLGLTEQLVFPELNPDKFTRPQGMNITIVTSAKSNDEGRDLLELFGMPFKQGKQKTDAA